MPKKFILFFNLILKINCFKEINSKSKNKSFDSLQFFYSYLFDAIDMKAF